MDIFVIHSSADQAQVETILSRLRQSVFSINPLVLRKGGKLWKIGARQKIRRAQLVLFAVGENSYASPYIAWEIRETIRCNKKLVTVLLAPENPRHPALEVSDAYTGALIPYDSEMDVDALIEYIRSFESGDYHIFNDPIDSLDQKLLLEQYKVFLQTSEALVARRQSVNNYYNTVNVALVTIVSTLLALQLNAAYKLYIGGAFSLFGMVLCMAWMGILVSYGNLNASKLKIISAMEKQLPASLFDAEWAALSDRLNKKRYVSFTSGERRVPKIFFAVYALALLCIVLYGVFVH